MKLWSGVLLLLSVTTALAADEPPAAHAAPTLSASTLEHFYDVSRWSLKELMVPSADAADRHPAAGLTSVELTLRKSLLQTDKGCRALELGIVIEIIITMPRWAGRAEDMPQGMQVALAHLRAHEQVHRDHAVEAGAGLAKALSTLPLDQNCAQLGQFISRHLERQMFRLRLRSDMFDQMTDFGRRGLPSVTPRSKRLPPFSRDHAQMPRW